MGAFVGLALGHTVHIEGTIGLTLLPELMLTATGVHVLNVANGGELHVQSLLLGSRRGRYCGGRWWRANCC